jgi:4-diphosphocytidyl-2-C-methyl-D-erythritol kinase
VIASATSPAKINLGLEILRKRADGFHEIRTILQMIDLVDDVSVRFSKSMQLACSDPELAQADNLALKAARLWSDELDPHHRSLDVSLVKRIPAAAGLGGASSNAAAVLVLAQELARFEAGAAPLIVSDRFELLQPLAARLGSDVPFFLASPAAVAHGRGELLEPVRPLKHVLIVVATPAIEIERKTATMYGALEPNLDFSDGSIVSEARQVLDHGDLLTGRHLFNAFERPLRAFYPELEIFAEIMGFYADGRVGLSGAGPTWYALVDTLSAARELTSALSSEVASARIVTGRPLAEPLHVELGVSA